MGDDASKREDGELLDPAHPATRGTSRLRELTPKAMWTTAVVITVLTTAAVVLLWWPATSGLNGSALVTARFDALKIGLSIGVGSGGVVALYLTWRRQHATEVDLDTRERTLAHQEAVAADTKRHQERIAEDSRLDATERRITELYTKAVEQLGSDKAPVRLGGLYALERLAQDNESQRQTIVNVLCAYLRMPEPPTISDEGEVPDRRTLQREYAQEIEVRDAAQRILTSHLKVQNNATNWGSRDLDLSGAHLRSIDLRDCSVGSARFVDANFSGESNFNDSIFTKGGVFFGAKFSGSALFNRSKFSDLTVFYSAKFESTAAFSGTEFSDSAEFDHAEFGGVAYFADADLMGGGSFTGTAFKSGATFRDAKVGDELGLDSSLFKGKVTFSGARFSGPVLLEKTIFTGDVKCNQCSFSDRLSVTDAKFHLEANFTSSNFAKIPNFHHAEFSRDPMFGGARLNGVEFDFENDWRRNRRSVE
ncbi:pentapeptide repeat-containing protein [Amycolatopsis sp. NPDC003676]